MNEGEIMSKKSLTRRDFLKAAALGTAGVTLAACQTTTQTPAEPQSNSGANPPAKEKQKVTFSMYGHPNLTEPMVKIFNESQSDVELVFERSEGQGYWEKLTAAIAGGTAWDCFRSDAPHSLEWGPKNAILDITQYVDADTKYPKADYLEGALDAFTSEGKIYSVPTWALTMWMFYNKQIFDDAGEKYPDPSMEWADYVQLAKRLTKREGNRTTIFGANGWTGWTFPLMQLFFSASGKFYYSDDMKQVVFDDPENVKVLQSLADMISKDQSIPNPTVQASSPIGIFSDNVATQGDGDYLPADNNEVMLEKYEYLDATLCPLVNGKRSNVYWPDGFAINAKTQVPEGAYKWMAWFGRDPEATAIQGKVVFPVYNQAYTDQSISSRWLVSPRPKGMIEQAAEHAKNAQVLRFERHASDLDTIYYNEIGKVWSGEATAEQVANIITEQGNQAMQK
jgi:multiple sugar transport system substrate-binding protein